MDQDAHAAGHIYHLPVWFRVVMATTTGWGLFCLGVIALFVGQWLPLPLVPLVVYSSTLRILVLVPLLLGVWLLLFWYWSSYRLHVSPSGVEFHTPRTTVAAGWERLEWVANVGGWRTPVRGLKLRSMTSLPFGYPLVAIPRSIPVGLFTLGSWTNSALRREIEQYIPAMLSSTASSSPSRL